MKEALLPPLSIMPSRAVADSRLTKTDWRVLAALCARRNKKTKLCNPSVSRIAADTSINARHVRRSRERLRRFGYIDWSRESSGRGSSCRYVIFDLTSGEDEWARSGKMRAENVPLYDDDSFFGDPVENDGGAGSDKWGAKRALLNGGQSCPPNIEGEQLNKNIPIKQSASLGGDAGIFRRGNWENEATKVGHGRLAIIERRIRKYGVTGDDLNELDNLFHQTASEPRGVFGHFLRVLEEAAAAAPEDIKPYWAKDGE